MKPMRLIPAVVLAVVALALGAAPASAQRGDAKARLEQELQRTDEMLAGARDDAGPDRPDNAAAPLAAAARQQERAWEYYRAGQLRPALRLTLQVREQLRNLDRHLTGGPGAKLRDRLQRAEALVRRASQEAALSGKRQRVALAARAREMLERAREKLADGRARPAGQHIEQAVRLAEQSLRRAGGDANLEEFETVVARYEARMAALEGRLAEYPSREATRLAEESREHFRLARELARSEGDDEGGDRERAMAEMRIATRLLERALELVQ